MNRLLVIAVGIVVVVCIGCSYKKKIDDAIILYKEGLHQSAFVTLQDGLLRYSAIDDVSNENIVFTTDAVFSADTLLTMLYPRKRTYNYSREVVSVGYDKDRDICVVTDGGSISLFQDKDETIIHNPSNELIKAIAVRDDMCYVLSGKELYVVDIRKNTSNKFTDIEFVPSELLKYYNGHIYADTNSIIVIIGIAGIYNAWIFDIQTHALRDSFRLASIKHTVKDDNIYYIKGITGKWELKRYTISTKLEKTIGKFSTLRDVHLLNEGIIANTGNEMMIYLYKDKWYTFPFVYTITGETQHVMMIVQTHYSLINAKKFFDMIHYFVEMTEYNNTR